MIAVLVGEEKGADIGRRMAGLGDFRAHMLCRKSGIQQNGNASRRDEEGVYTASAGQ